MILLSLASSLGYHAVIDNAAEKDSTQVSALVDSLQETDLVMTSIDEVISKSNNCEFDLVHIHGLWTPITRTASIP